MSKQDTMNEWGEMKPDQAILPVMTPVPYGAKGSTFGACGIRIDGNPAFVNAVMSRLQDLMEGENANTRLSLSRQSVKSDKDRDFGNSTSESEVCYIRLHQRGRVKKSLV